MNRELEQAVEAALKLDGARGNPETPSAAAAVETSPLEKRAKEALRRITSGLGPMRVPADPNDADLVIVDLMSEVDRLKRAHQSTISMGADVIRYLEGNAVYERARADGLEAALRVVREGGHYVRHCDAALAKFGRGGA